MSSIKIKLVHEDCREEGNTLSVHASNMRESHESIGIAIDITRIAKGILARGATTQQGVLATCSSHVMREVNVDPSI